MQQSKGAYLVGHPEFPHCVYCCLEVLALREGLTRVADAFDAEMLRIPEESPLSAARRKKLIHKFGRDAALRLRSFRDPDFPYGY